MDNIWLALFWTGPIGVGVFLMGLGVLFWGISRMSREERAEKRSQAPPA